MNLSPHDPTAPLLLGAFLSPQEPPVSVRAVDIAPSPEEFALLGIRLPLRGGEGLLRAIVDADGTTIAVLIPSPNAATDVRRAAAIAAAVNAGAGSARLPLSSAAE